MSFLQKSATKLLRPNLFRCVSALDSQRNITLLTSGNDSRQPYFIESQFSRHSPINVISRARASTTLTGNDHHNIAKVQHPAPDFKGMAVVGGQFKEICLKDFSGKYLLLFFYPLDFTFVCPTEVIAFNDRADEFKALNTELVAVSVDSQFSHLAWINTPRKNGGLGSETKIPILSDLKKKIASDYGCLTGNGDIALRATYIIDTKGVIRQITINDLPVGRSVDEALRLIRAFQFVDEHGEVCPANWQPKSKTINPKKASEYFSSVF